jgi:hypothetical protein
LMRFDVLRIGSPSAVGIRGALSTHLRSTIITKHSVELPFLKITLRHCLNKNIHFRFFF